MMDLIVSIIGSLLVMVLSGYSFYRK